MKKGIVISAIFLILIIGFVLFFRETILIFSINRNLYLLAKVCLAIGADPNTLDNNGIPMLLLALNKPKKWNTDFLKLLLESGANPNICSSNRRTPLHVAINRAPLASIVALLRYGADPNARTTRCETPLFIGAYRGETALILELIKAGAKDLGETDSGNALNIARNLGFSEIASFLTPLNANSDKSGR